MTQLLENLGLLYALNPVAGLKDWFTYESNTPKYRFSYYVSTEISAGHLVLISLRGDYSEDSLLAFCRSVDEARDEVSKVEIPSKIHPVTLENSGFDTLMLVPPGFHDAFAVQNELLAKCTMVAFPAFNCEFSANETKASLDVLRRGVVPTLDWNRAPAPRVAMKYSNPRIRGGSAGNHRGLADRDTARRELCNLPASPGGFVELENFAGDVITVSFTDNCLVLERDGVGRSFDDNLDELLAAVDAFLFGLLNK
ncbi:hypothetical protein [Luteolibacter sp. Populi]|uniref:hypothetical protein n=1 Tax=Luteolibacter sp. Populi TaxID=3230487 RepID=UPI003465E0F2